MGQAHFHFTSPNLRILYSFVQQPVQQRRRKTAKIGDTQRTTGPGNKHEESISEYERTLQSVSRMRYYKASYERLKQGYKELGTFRFRASLPLCSNWVTQLILLLIWRLSLASQCIFGSFRSPLTLWTKESSSIDWKSCKASSTDSMARNRFATASPPGKSPEAIPKSFYQVARPSTSHSLHSFLAV